MPPTSARTLTHKPLPFTFDPSSPLALTTPTTNSLLTCYAHTGIGCNSDETTCLLELLDARDALPSPAKLTDLQRLSERYLTSLQNTVERWSERTSSNNEKQSSSSSSSSSSPNLFYLNVISSFTHLSVTYLLTPPRTLQIPGALTSATVTYLKQHFCFSPLDWDDDDGDVDVNSYTAMLNGAHPEYNPSYWPLLNATVSRGDLNDAWAILSRHSRCRACFDEGDERAHDKIGFELLYKALTEAPLPGMDERWEDEASVAAARGAWNEWHARVLSVLKDGEQGAAAGGLFRRVPPLRRVMEIIAGRVEEHQNWSDALLNELLYLRPGLVGADMPIRMKCLIRATGEENDVEKTTLMTIMSGDATKAIEALHGLGGGGGAALPATMTALLADLLIMAGRMPFLEIPLRRSLFASAASACQSSFHSLGHATVGVRCAARLLTISGDVEGLADLLARSFVESDSEACQLLGFVKVTEDMTMEERIVLSEAGRHVALCRFRTLWKDHRPAGATHWLLKAIHFEKGSYSNATQDHLENLCQTTAQHLLTSLVQELFGQKSRTPHTYLVAKEMLSVLTIDENQNKKDGVVVLNNILSIADHLLNKENVKAGHLLIDCLQYTQSLSKASLSMWPDLFKLAFHLLQKEEDETKEHSHWKAHIFDVDAVQHLLGCLAIMEAYPGGKDMLITTPPLKVVQDPSPPNDDNDDDIIEEDVISYFSLDKYRLLLGTGLARALVSENEKRKIAHNGPSFDTNQTSHVKVDVGMDELVDLMLAGPPAIL
mmetsp:Transcript_31749/g.38895  ORF Transcript_31749/g.38895 Transcript_31749/m.38895 type:complete len:774 (-) Transcript_31749:125-2446(-)|eukprot:CAMPEP_0172501708 /NCGR_PEP_ID=MMETSP1066-20121228/152660_1 /TAXON_ID=671091 /ORGANISM="Coscinodiscus wailesii, Strain CCMP2513" /LENGTH=773 /DNA_ID=CAMNT_0013276651 /DNA_START=203 /DNA_END=2524 /DNA_ORIENTATION=+